MIDGSIVCSNCNTNNLELMWNLTVGLTDGDVELTNVKLNNDITRDLFHMTAEEAFQTYYGKFEDMKSFVYKRLINLHGVFKISAKKASRTFFNIL
jgi:hypothetical protein